MNKEDELVMKQNMKKEQALNIIQWREEGDIDDEGNGLSWRGVAYTFIKYYPVEANEWNITQPTQPCGMTLCKIAYEKLDFLKSEI